MITRDLGHAVIGYVHPDYVRAEFMASMLALTHASEAPIDSIQEIRSGPNISRARNMMCRKFMEDQTAEWLLMIDSDMVFAPDTLDRLIAVAHRKHRPIVGALCFSEGDDGGDPYSTMYELIEKEPGFPAFVRYSQWPDDAMVRVGATGTGCLLVHRDALDKVAKAKPDPICPWFRESYLGKSMIGEDLTFCLRAAAADVPVHVYTGIQVGHMKSTMLGKVI